MPISRLGRPENIAGKKNLNCAQEKNRNRLIKMFLQLFVFILHTFYHNVIIASLSDWMYSQESIHLLGCTEMHQNQQFFDLSSSLTAILIWVNHFDDGLLRTCCQIFRLSSANRCSLINIPSFKKKKKLTNSFALLFNMSLHNKNIPFKKVVWDVTAFQLEISFLFIRPNNRGNHLW